MAGFSLGNRLRGSTGLSSGGRLSAGTGLYFGGFGFSPASLFAAGEQGVWYDPSDLTTLFQDSAGNTPVTAVEQAVGLMLDKSKGLTLGSELVVNGTFPVNTASWSAGGGASIARDTTVFSNGALLVTVTGASSTFALQTVTGLTAGKIYILSADVYTPSSNSNSTDRATIGVQVSSFTSAGSVSQSLRDVIQTITIRFIASGTSQTIYCSVVPTDYTVWGTLGNVAYFDNISVKELLGNHATQSTSAARPVLSARVNLLLATTTLATQSVTTVATGHTLRFDGTGSITLSGTAAGTYTAGSYTFTPTAGTLTLTVSGSVTDADLRATNDGVGLPVYQRVNTSTDYDTTGFPLYLRFDGTDDSMATGSISFTSTDKMSVFSGLRKLSDALEGCFVELSTNFISNNGSFTMFARGSNYPTGFDTPYRGTIQVTTPGFVAAAPTSQVITSSYDIAAPLAVFRSNGVQVSSTTSTAGTGNFGNYPLYIGSRAGTSSRFNGRLYSLIVRGAASTAQQISDTETWINGKAKAY